MKKKIVITSLILVIVPSILFSILYGVMTHVIYNSGEDCSEAVLGEWAGIQYLTDKQLNMCDDDTAIGVTFEENCLVITGNLLEPGTYDYSWDTGSIARVKYNNEDCIFVLSVNSIGQLKMTINSMDYIITFNKVVAK